MEATLQQPSTVIAEPTPQAWFNTIYRQKAKFGHLEQQACNGVIAECCGNIHLQSGLYPNSWKTPVAFKEAAESWETLNRNNSIWQDAYALVDQKGIYSAEFMTGEELRNTVGIPNGEYVEFTDNDGNIHSFAWKDE